MEYCERTVDAFWAEPLNALTNLAFIIAGVALVHLLLRRPGRGAPWEVVVLIFLVFSIGAGSFLWHTFATPWSALMDEIPIILYINVFLASYLVRIARSTVWWGVGLFLLFHAFNAGLQASVPADFLNGSTFYLPAWLTLVVMAFHARAQGRANAYLLTAAAAIFAVSLTFRSIDNAVCGFIPAGTHFLWHVLNGMVLYLTTRFLMAVPGRHPGDHPPGTPP